MDKQIPFSNQPQGRAVVILNPTSGQETAPDYAPLIEETLRRYFREVDIRVTEKAGDAIDFARQACGGNAEAVFAVGGDGTVNEVLTGLAEEENRPKLGIFPAGTFNAVARLLRIPLNIEAAIRRFDPDLFLPIDIGRVNDRYFGYVLSIGDIPEAIHGVTIEEKTNSGIFAYIKRIAQRFGNVGTYTISVKADGELITEEASHLLLLLSDYIGPMQFLSEGATLSDGLMNLLIARGSTLPQLLGILPDFLAGQVEKNKNVEFRKVKEVRVISSSKLTCDIDGDEGPSLPLEISVLPRHILAYYGSEELEEKVGVFPDEEEMIQAVPVTHTAVSGDLAPA